MSEPTHADHHHAQQPSTHYCFGCGVLNQHGLQVRFFNDGPGACRAEVTLDDRFQGFPGIVHGGIVATLLDEALGRAALSGNSTRLMFTGRLELKYRQHTPLNTPLVVTARIVRDRGKAVTAEGELRQADGTLLAHAEATLFELPRETLDSMDIDSVGWKVFP